VDRENTLQVIFDPPLSGYENMARDEVLWEGRGNEEELVLRFFSWEKKTLSIGRFQRTQDIDRSFLHAQGISLVRRPTGGRAILHEDDLTLSLAMPRGGVSLDTQYRQLKEVFGQALFRIGIPVDEEIDHFPVRLHSPACFALSFPHELTVKGKKIAGIAQARNKERTLFQVSLPFSIDRVLVASCFHHQELVYTDLRENFSALEEIGFHHSLRARLMEVLLESLEDLWRVKREEREWKSGELLRVRTLLEEKYALDSYHWER